MKHMKVLNIPISLAIKSYLKITQISWGLNMLLSRVDLREHRYEANHNALQCGEKRSLRSLRLSYANTAAQAKRIMANVLTKVVLP